nr:MAG TPA: hypothetical protein [Caudoviricetes sp.]
MDADCPFLMILPYLSHYPRHIIHHCLCLVIKKLSDIPAIHILFIFCFYAAE